MVLFPIIDMTTSKHRIVVIASLYVNDYFGISPLNSRKKNDHCSS